jgi:hypothetical protein
MRGAEDTIESFIADWIVTGGSELANTQSFVNGLCALIGVDPPKGSQSDVACCRFDGHRDKLIHATPASRSKSMGLL